MFQPVVILNDYVGVIYGLLEIDWDCYFNELGL